MAIKSQSARMPNCWCTARSMRGWLRCSLPQSPPNRSRWALLDQTFLFHRLMNLRPLRDAGFEFGQHRPFAQIYFYMAGPVQHREQIGISHGEGIAHEVWFLAQESR